MSQILSAARKSVSKKSGVNYEDLDAVQDTRRNEAFSEGPDSISHMGQELEMNSVSVVPDGIPRFS